MFFQQLLNGLLLGGLYSAIAIGFSLVYGVLGIVNLAHGSLIMVGAYITFSVFRSWLHLDPFLSLPVAGLVVFALAYVSQQYVMNRVIKQNLSMTMVLTYGLDMIFANTAELIWSPNYQSVTPAYLGSVFHIAGAAVSYSRVGVLGVSMLIAYIVYLFLNRTAVGSAIRATALDPEAARIVGVNVDQIYALTFAIGGLIAGASGALLTTVFPLNPYMGASFLGKSFAVAVLGGLGDIKGAILGGFILGIVEALGVVVIGAEFQQAIAFALLLLLLVIRPQGLMGRRFYR